MTAVTNSLKTKTFSMYRNTYNFTDKEIYFFLFFFLLFVIYLIYSFFAYSITEIEGRMFYLFLFPLALFVGFDIKSKYVNRKRKKVIFKRKLQRAKQLDKIFIIYADDNDIMLSKFTPEREIELKISRILDINYELKTIALEGGYEAIIGVKKEDGFIRGYLANKK